MTSLPYWLGTIGYCVAMVFIGVWIRRRIRHDQGEQMNFEFWIAKRQLPGWRLAISLTAGWLMLGWVGFGMSQIYMYGATGLWILPIPWLILCVLVIFMVPFVRRIAAVSLPQGIGKRYGSSARTILAVLSLLVFLSWTQAELFMGGYLMAPFLPLPAWLQGAMQSCAGAMHIQATEMQLRQFFCMFLLVLPIIIYVWLGGFRANVATDVAQFALMAPFMIILAVFAINGAVSHGNVIETLRQTTPPWADAGQMFNLGFLGWLFPVILLIGYLPGWLIEQDLVIRLQAARSTRESRKAAWWGLLLIGVFVIILPAIIAFCSLVIYPPQNGGPNHQVGDAAGQEAYNICSALIQQMPGWLSVFMLIGIIASQMSTVDTFANVSALALAYNLVEPSAKGLSLRSSPRGRLMLARVISVLVLLIALVCAAVSQSLKDVYYISSGILSACVAIPTIFVFWRRTTLPAVITAAILGFVGTVGAFIFEYHTAATLDIVSTVVARMRTFIFGHQYQPTTDATASHSFKDVVPGWLVNSQGYNYLAVGVLLSLVSIVVVSLLTRRPARNSFRPWRPGPSRNTRSSPPAHRNMGLPSHRIRRPSATSAAKTEPTKPAPRFGSSADGVKVLVTVAQWREPMVCQCGFPMLSSAVHPRSPSGRG